MRLIVLTGQVLIGLSRPFNFHLPPSQATPIVMIAGGSGIGPFKAFWEARALERNQSRNVLFLGVQSRQTFLYETEIRSHVENGTVKLG